MLGMHVQYKVSIYNLYNTVGKKCGYWFGNFLFVDDVSQSLTCIPVHNASSHYVRYTYNVVSICNL